MRKTTVLGIIVLVIIGSGIAIASYSRVVKKTVIANPFPSMKAVAGATDSHSYFDDNARVKFYYSENCPWSQKEKLILEDLGKDGLRVKPMNIDANPDLLKQDDIKGTPTFIAIDGTRISGFKEKGDLKDFLTKYQ